MYVTLTLADDISNFYFTRIWPAPYQGCQSTTGDFKKVQSRKCSILWPMRNGGRKIKEKPRHSWVLLLLSAIIDSFQMHNFCRFRTFPNCKRPLASPHCVLSYFQVHHWQYIHEQENMNAKQRRGGTSWNHCITRVGNVNQVAGQWLWKQKLWHVADFQPSSSLDEVTKRPIRRGFSEQCHNIELKYSITQIRKRHDRKVFVVVLLASPLDTTQKVIRNSKNSPGCRMWWLKI